MEKPPRAFEAPRIDRPNSAQPTEPELHEKHDPYAVFRFRSYRYFAIGVLASVLGRQMLAVAVEWEIYQRTHSAAALGLVGLTLAIPIILLAIPAGHLADRAARKTILITTQIVTIATSVTLALLSIYHADLRFYYGVLLVSGTSRAFGWAARGSFLPNLVPAQHLANAVTWNSSTFQFSSVAGPALSGFFIYRFGFPAIYLVDATLALLFLLLLLPIRVAPQVHAPRAAGWASLLSGIRFVRDTRVILATVTLDLFAVLFGGATALLPIFADQILHCGPIGLGWMRAAPSVGSLGMGILLAHLPPMRAPGKTMLRAVAGFGLATLLFGLSRWLPLTLFLLALIGACDSVSVVVRHTLVQLLTPDGMRGRVSAVNNVFIGSSNELGAFESGMTAKWLGPIISVVGGGCATLLVVFLVKKRWPEIMRLGPFAELKAAALSTK